MKPVSVLVVDDETNIRETLADILMAHGYQVDVADSGEQAVTRCSERHYGAILMDVRMPGINGVEAFRRIRNHRPAARVIMMSAYSVDQLREEALREGAAAWLPKPLDVQKVLDLIREPRDTSVLIVDRAMSDIVQLSEQLGLAGYSTTMTPSAAEAIKLVEQVGFDVVLVSRQLSSMVAEDLCLAIRRITPSTLAVLMDEVPARDGFTDDELSGPLCAVLTKPVDPEAMLVMLKQLVSENRHSDLSGAEAPEG